MKILLVSPLPPPMGGIATLTERIITKLSTSDVKFECVNVAHRVDQKNIRITKYSRIEPIFILCRSVFTVFTKCLARQCDVIHINSSSGAGTIRDYFIERVASFFKVPVILQYHCSLDCAVNSSWIARKYCKKSFDLSSKIIVLNRTSQEFVRKNGFESIIVPNGIPDNSIASEHFVRPCISKAVFTGRISESKGCMEIYECAKVNPQIEFHLAGLIDSEIEKQLTSLNNIKLLGVLSHAKVTELLDTADVFVFPTYTEGFSVSLLEAMARGLPCITTKVGANEDMLEGMGGVIVEPKNSEAVIVAMKEILSSDVRQKMSAWNLKKVRAVYTEEKMFKQLSRVYRGVSKNI